MNILVVCHNYKEHQLLTLVLGEKKYIYLTPENIPKISRLTNGIINKIAFIDDDRKTYKETDEYQYNNWNKVPNDYFDYFFTIHCPPGINFDQYRSKLKDTGKRINIDFVSKRERPTLQYEYSDFYPFIVSPIYNETRFGPYIYYLTINDVNTNSTEIKFVNFNRDFIPKMNDYGHISIPTITIDETPTPDTAVSAETATSISEPPTAIIHENETRTVRSQTRKRNTKTKTKPKKGGKRIQRKQTRKRR